MDISTIGMFNNANFVLRVSVMLAPNQDVTNARGVIIFMMESVMSNAQMELMFLTITMQASAENAHQPARPAQLIIIANPVQKDILW